MWWWNSFQTRRSSDLVRSTGSSRRYSMKPVGLPMLIPADAREVARVLFEGHHDGLIARQSLRMRAFERGEGALEVLGHDGDEPGKQALPVLEHVTRAGAARERGMALYHPAHARDFLRVLQLLDRHHLRVDLAREVPRLVEHVGDAARHAGAEVAAGGAEHQHVAAGHVLAAVIADRLDDRIGAAVAHGEPLARHAADVGLAARRAVQPDVADDDVLFRRKR